jgi:uncharacterized protein
MPSVRRRPSLNSVVIKSIDRDKVHKAVLAYAEQLRRQHAEIVRIIWFGAWVMGLPSPGSDVDLCLILSKSDKPYRDRIPDYLPLGFPVGIDLVRYTEEEFDRLKQTSPEWYKAIAAGVEV